MADNGYKILDPLSNSLAIEKKFNKNRENDTIITMVDKSLLNDFQIKMGDLEINIKININRGC